MGGPEMGSSCQERRRKHRQAWPQGMFPPPAWQIPSALLKHVSPLGAVWAANVDNRRSTAELPQSEQEVEFSDCSRRLSTSSSNLVPQSKHWYSKIGISSKLSLTGVSDRPGDVAHAFSVPRRAVGPDISEIDSELVSATVQYYHSSGGRTPIQFPLCVWPSRQEMVRAHPQLLMPPKVSVTFVQPTTPFRVLTFTHQTPQRSLSLTG